MVLAHIDREIIGGVGFDMALILPSLTAGSSHLADGDAPDEIVKTTFCFLFRLLKVILQGCCDGLGVADLAVGDGALRRREHRAADTFLAPGTIFVSQTLIRCSPTSIPSTFVPSPYAPTPVFFAVRIYIYIKEISLLRRRFSSCTSFVAAVTCKLSDTRRSVAPEHAAMKTPAARYGPNARTEPGVSRPSG